MECSELRLWAYLLSIILHNLLENLRQRNESNTENLKSLKLSANRGYPIISSAKKGLESSSEYLP